MNNIPAFPRPLGENSYGENDSQKGMTLLDYFANSAMQSLLCAPFLDLAEGAKTNIITEAYNIAFKMIKEREKYEHLS